MSTSDTTPRPPIETLSRESVGDVVATRPPILGGTGNAHRLKGGNAVWLSKGALVYIRLVPRVDKRVGDR